VGTDPARERCCRSDGSWSAWLYFGRSYGEKKRIWSGRPVQGVYRCIEPRRRGQDAKTDRARYATRFQYAAIVSTKGALMFVELRGWSAKEKLLAAFKFISEKPAGDRPRLATCATRCWRSAAEQRRGRGRGPLSVAGRIAATKGKSQARIESWPPR